MNYATSDIEVFAFIVEQVHVHVHDLMYRQSWKIGEILSLPFHHSKNDL